MNKDCKYILTRGPRGQLVIPPVVFAVHRVLQLYTPPIMHFILVRFRIMVVTTKLSTTFLITTVTFLALSTRSAQTVPTLLHTEYFAQNKIFVIAKNNSFSMKILMISSSRLTLASIILT